MVVRQTHGTFMYYTVHYNPPIEDKHFPQGALQGAMNMVKN